MILGAEQKKAELIDKVAAQALSRLKPERAAVTEQFIRQFLSNVAPDDIIHESLDNIYGAALSLWDLCQERDAGVIKIRAFNPRLENHGWQSTHSIIEIVNDDMPFLVDSVAAALARFDAEIYLVIHPILCVQRDAPGKLANLCSPNQDIAGSVRESAMHIQISEQTSEQLDVIRADLEDVLCNVRAAVIDWRAMGEGLDELVRQLESSPPSLPAGEIEETIALLKWLGDDNFTFLGYREYAFEGSGADAVARILPESGLGILRDEQVSVFDGLRNLGSLPDDVRDFLKQPELLRITKANRRSVVHRPVHMDTVAVKRFNEKGKVTGERLLIGLFTSVAYSRSPRKIPLLRQKVANIMARAGFPQGSHDAKALSHILETFPRDELFQSSEDELFDTVMGVLHLQERHRIALFVRRDPFERYVSCLVYIPRDRYDSALRIKIQECLTEVYQGSVAAFFTHLTDAALARLHVIVKTTPGEIPDIDIAELEKRLIDVGRSWSDRLKEDLIADRGEEQGIRCLRRFAKAFPANYEDHFNEHTAIFDIARIETALETGDLAMNLYRPVEAEASTVRFKIYRAGAPVPLSDVLPMLENMGLKVISENPFDMKPADLDQSVWMHDFEMVTEGNQSIDLDEIRGAFHDTFASVWRGEMEDDGFNKLVLRAGLAAREVVVLRAYCKFLRQARIPFSQTYMEQTLAGNPGITKLLSKLFMTLFALEKTSDKKSKEAKAKEIISNIEQALEGVTNLDEDRIIRHFLNAIQSTLRTNFFQTTANGKPKAYLSLKLDSRKIDELPQPRPFREIFVYSPEVEGVHLRFGMVARGGLRWSDRREDFRTEILGLVKAQQVKNAVIVPVGSKGGFVVKRPPPAEAGRDAFIESGIECYKTFISGLLDITDNLEGLEVVPPVDVVRRDDNDPYLVVAADKGTATFSDIANGVSAEYGFWLDDAFASGGSAGYDHKKMGITARGVWESVKRHFREVGKDIQSDDFAVVGCGDMSGDVFGNGMLLSKHIKLVGAFNHMHIFIDPNPDPEASWQERNRLFKLPRSSWTDYSEALISKGGAIFERKAKSLKLSPEIQQLFAINRDSVTPNELLQAMLKADVELLWFGGIGTYIKASNETHADVGDRANDALRVNANEVLARVIGEGANLGMTQRARIESALRGGRLNTDSIDNSAGVDCSDHEVNIKILLGAIEADGDLTREKRNQLLEKMTDEVSGLVLRDNYLQTQAITVTQTLGAHLLDRLARYMRKLEKNGQLNRHIEFLPDDETIAERQTKGIGFTRPELAVLLSYAKITLYDELLSSDLPDDPFMEDDLIRYFPSPLRDKYAAQIAAHRLRREIIATVVTNTVLNRVGIGFIHEVREKTGMAAADIARAYMISRDIFGMRDLFAAIEGLDNRVPATLQASMLIECGRLIERGTVWFLLNAGQPLDIGGQVGNFRADVAELTESMADLLSGADQARLAERAAAFVEQGAPEDLALRIAKLSPLVPACDIVKIAKEVNLPVTQVGKAYFAIGERFGFDWLRRAAGYLPSDNAWDKLAVTAIVDDLYGHQDELATRVLRDVADATAAEAVVDAWAEARRPLVARTEQLLAELQATAAPDLAMLAVANRQLKSMVSG